MDHLRFKSEQTAAAYVAGGLDPEARDEFELHMMSCPECVDEVEGWRAIKSCLPEAAASSTRGPVLPSRQHLSSASASSASRSSASTIAGPTPAGRAVKASGAARPMASSSRWRFPAALAASVAVGAVGGWFGHSVRGPSVDSDAIGFYSLPPLTRGPSDCTSVRVGPHVALIALRVPAAAREQQLVAVDSEGHDLASDQYSVRTQTDGSWLVRLRADAVREQGIRFEARSADGTAEPRGCVLSGPQD